MTVSAQDVKRLRDMTGAGMMDCKEALTEVGGDLERAIDQLRKKGLSKAAKKAGRETKEGTVHAYVHPGGAIGVLIEVACETDFVARTEEFQRLVHDLALQVAAAQPRFVRREDVDSASLERERAIYRDQLRDAEKPPQVIEKIIDGKLGKFYSEVCLLEQPFIKDANVTVDELLQAAIAKLGENIKVARFTRYALGEAG